MWHRGNAISGYTSMEDSYCSETAVNWLHAARRHISHDIVIVEASVKSGHSLAY